MDKRIKWTKDIATGIRQIDFQHQKFFKLMNELLSSAIKGEEVKKLNKSVAMLKGYIIYHFSLEEELMEISKYPGYEEHRRAHRLFRENFAKMELLIKAQESPSKEIVKKYNFMLLEWFYKHIKVVDKKMTRHLLSYGEESKGFLEKMAEILTRPFGG